MKIHWTILFFCIFRMSASAQTLDYVLTDGASLLSYSGGAVQKDIGSSLAISRTNYTIIKSWIDLTNQAVSYSAGIIQQPAGTVWELNGVVNSGPNAGAATNQIQIGSSSLVCGRNRSVDGLFHIGTNPLFLATNGFFEVKDMFFLCPNANLFQVSHTNSGTFSFEHNLAVTGIGGIGTVDNFDNVIFRDNTIGNIGNGFTVYGVSVDNLIFEGNIFAAHGSSNVNYLALSTSTWDIIRIANNAFHLDTNVNVNVLSGVTNSGNLIPGGSAVLVGNSVMQEGGLSDHTNYVTGLDHSDLQWRWSGNQGFDDSKAHGSMFVTTSTIIPISGTGIPALVTNWVSGVANERFRFETNTLFCTSLAEVLVSGALSVTMDVVSGNNQQINMELRFNGTTIFNKSGEIDTGASKSVTIPIDRLMRDGDSLQVFIENQTQNRNPIIDDAQLVLDD